MSAVEIKAKVEAVYQKAISTRNVFYSGGSSSLSQFSSLKLYGREAGEDFVRSNLDLFVKDATDAAECKQTSISLSLCGSGQAAIEGVAAALRDLTALEVDVQQRTVKLTWA